MEEEQQQEQAYGKGTVQRAACLECNSIPINSSSWALGRCFFVAFGCLWPVLALALTTTLAKSGLKAEAKIKSVSVKQNAVKAKKRKNKS